MYIGNLPIYVLIFCYEKIMSCKIISLCLCKSPVINMHYWKI